MSTTEVEAKLNMERTMYDKLKEAVTALNQAIWFDSTMTMLYGKSPLTDLESAYMTEARNDIHKVLDLTGSRRSRIKDTEHKEQ